MRSIPSGMPTRSISSSGIRPFKYNRISSSSCRDISVGHTHSTKPLWFCNSRVQPHQEQTNAFATTQPCWWDPVVLSCQRRAYQDILDGSPAITWEGCLKLLHQSTLRCCICRLFEEFMVEESCFSWHIVQTTCFSLLEDSSDHKLCELRLPRSHLLVFRAFDLASSSRISHNSVIFSGISTRDILLVLVSADRGLVFRLPDSDEQLKKRLPRFFFVFRLSALPFLGLAGGDVEGDVGEGESDATFRVAFGDSDRWKNDKGRDFLLASFASENFSWVRALLPSGEYSSCSSSGFWVLATVSSNDEWGLRRVPPSGVWDKDSLWNWDPSGTSKEGESTQEERWGYSPEKLKGRLVPADFFTKAERRFILLSGTCFASSEFNLWSASFLCLRRGLKKRAEDFFLCGDLWVSEVERSASSSKTLSTQGLSFTAFKSSSCSSSKAAQSRCLISSLSACAFSSSAISLSSASQSMSILARGRFNSTTAPLNCLGQALRWKCNKDIL